ncbi:hypothetical protein C8R46DRAFT_997945 [Mycena filopes]|nr:hypothetical protein C8R46DRAFT_997945 [Mycena filopes]
MPPKLASARDKAVSKAVGIYVRALKDPDNPAFCGRGLFGLLTYVLPLPTNTVDTDVRASHPEFWDVSLGFLTHNRSEEVIQGLVDRLSECHCSLKDPYVLDLHAQASRWEEGKRERGGDRWVRSDADYISRALFPETLFSLLAWAIGTVKTKKLAKGAKQSWPKTITDLIPLGAEAAVKAIVQWHRALENDLLVFSILEPMVRVCRTLILPQIADSPLPGLMVSSGRALFDSTYAGLDAADLEVRRHYANRFFHQVYPISSLLLCLMEHCNTIGEVQFARGNETKLVQLCNLLVHLSTDPRLPPERPNGDTRRPLAGCIMWASTSYRMFHMYLPPRPPIVLHPAVARYDLSHFPPPPTVRNVRETVHIGLASMHKAMSCAALDCTQSFQSSGKAFMRCSQCRVVCYCSKACQTRAWREEKYPHRKVCPIIAWLVVLAGEDATTQSWECRTAALEKWAQARVPEDDMQIAHDWFRLLNVQSDAYLPNGTEWRPGFDDYDEVVGRFGVDGNGPKSSIVNPLARWPSEEAKVKTAHEALPFYGEDFA